MLRNRSSAPSLPAAHLLLKCFPSEEVHHENQAAHNSREPPDGAVLQSRGGGGGGGGGGGRCLEWAWAGPREGQHCWRYGVCVAKVFFATAQLHQLHQ